MIYAQYYYQVEGQLVEAIGDRAVIILDGRRSLNNLIADAIESNEVKRPRFDAFDLRRGTFTKNAKLTKPINLKPF